MTEKSGYEVFLSYSSKDKQWVTEFASALRDAGVKTLFDVSELTPGEPWQERIADALRESRTLVMILGPHSAESPWTFFELGAAIADHKRIIPVVTADIDLSRLPMALRRRQLLKESSPQEAGRRVAEVLGRDVAPYLENRA
ncbi:MAG TPA: toll/interleukin-1 receptor domain-containing protein [Thermoanaerobaculia bacterium]|nr:toll/interleukin-1 receptor domain-containing protein [Thermoanaerobaculia bacterium]